MSKRLYKTKRLYENHLNNKMSLMSPTKDSIAVAIRFLKRQTTLRARRIDQQFSWQSRYYDHIIRDDIEHYFISEYIISNPKNWLQDKNFS